MPDDRITPLARRVLLGPTGIEVSPLGIGAWAWGDRLFWDYGHGYGHADLQAAYNVSTQLDINFFDTAEIYGWGRSEKLLGEFARDAQQHVIATKFFPYPWRLRRQSLLDALRGSLRRIGRDRVDLYQIHFPHAPRSVETWMDALADAFDAGLARAVGVSNFNVSQMRRAHTALERRGIPLASNQVEYSLLAREPEDALLDACRELDITLVAYSPLAMGVLTGKYTPENPPSGYRRQRYKPGRLARIQPLIGLLQEIGATYGAKTPAQVALNWVMCRGALPIPGAKNEAQARENAGALGWTLTREDVVTLNAASAGL